MTVSRTGSSCASSAYVLPAGGLERVLLMISACTKAVKGRRPLALERSASSGMVMFSAVS